MKKIITIGRQFGSGGREVGQKVAQALHITYYDKELLAVAAKKSGLSSQFMNTYDEKPTRSFLYSLVMGQRGLFPDSAEVTVSSWLPMPSGTPFWRWLERAAASSLAAAPTMSCGMSQGF